MHDLGGSNVTDAVIAQMASTPDPRLREVMESLVWHLHAFAGDVSLTRAEWLAAVEFLARVGQAGTPDRPEFVLLSDALGLSDLVGALDDVLGPAGGAMEAGPPGLATGESVAAPSANGPEIVVFGRVLDDTGRGVAGASVEVRQPRAGEVDAVQGRGAAEEMMCGRFTTGPDGSYAFLTARPLGRPIPVDGPVGRLVRAQGRQGRRPARIGFRVSAPRHLELATAVYFNGYDGVPVASRGASGLSGNDVAAAEAGAQGSPRPDLPGLRCDFRIARREARGSAATRAPADSFGGQLARGSRL